MLALACSIVAPAASGGGGDPDPARVASALLRAVKAKQSLRAFMSPRVLLVYHEDGRCLGSIDGTISVAAPALDGTVSIRCRHVPMGGNCGAWEGKPLKPRAKTVKLDLRHEARQALDCIAAMNREAIPSMHVKPVLDRKQLIYTISCHDQVTLRFHLRREERAILVHKVVYSVEDPG